MVQAFHILGSLILKARLPINKTEGGTVWSLISRPCGQKALGGASLCSVLAQLSEKAEPFTTGSDSLAGPPRHLTCIKWKVNWKNGQELLM